MSFPNDIKPEIRCVIDDMFIKTADFNYTLARWCFFNRIPGEFLWSAMHALEKYMKAAILMNGGSTKEFGHDLIALYEKILHFSKDVLPERLIKPKRLNSEHWSDEKFSHFIDRLNRDGHPRNRYGTFGFDIRASDLFKLDQVILPIRVLCQTLTDHFYGAPTKELPNDSIYDRIKQDGHLIWQPKSKLHEIADNKYGAELKNALLDYNDQFKIDKKHVSPPLSLYDISTFSSLERYVCKNSKNSILLWNWIDNHIKIDSVTRSEVNKKIRTKKP